MMCQITKSIGENKILGQQEKNNPWYGGDKLHYFTMKDEDSHLATVNVVPS